MPETTTIDRLADALDPLPREVISLVGGGGKTTTLFALGRQLPGRVILSTTTKMGSDRRDGLVPLVAPGPDEISTALARDRVVLAWKRIERHRAVGFAPSECAEWTSAAEYLVLEADGSRRRPFKAPASHEPVVPDFTTLLVACVGADAFGASIHECCHRPEVVAEVTGCAIDDVLTPSRMAAVLTSPLGSSKDRPPPARFAVLLHQVRPEHTDFVDELAGILGDPVRLVAIAPFDARR